MNPDVGQARDGPRPGNLTAGRKAYIAVTGLLGLYLLIRLALSRHPVWLGVLGPIVLVGMASAFFRMQTRRAFMTLFGQIEYADEVSPKVEERLRSRYREQIDEFTSLGFHRLFFQGQTFPILRLVMVFPAIVVALMFLNREVIALHRGGRFLIGHCILASADQTTYVQILRLGVLFATLFENGEVLISCNYGSDNLKWQKLTRHAYRGESTADTWTKHQQWVNSKEIQGTRADRSPSFEKFVNMVG
ncbi:MAG TPA: hypothetical protein VHW46_02195 [Terracidiphilus sp.]|nr:hypothetical protein [Terracidiphilus sp.]